ncbi:unnamed protein product, partial [Effrenium voratum]
AWQRFLGAMKDREADEKLFKEIALKACSDVNKKHMYECQEQFLSTRSEMKDMDCHYQLVHTLHAHCPAAQSHHASGGWNGYNMKFSQVLVNLCEGQEGLGKSPQQLVQIVQEQCALARGSATELVV